MVKLVGRAVPATYGGAAVQCSHLCETFTRLISASSGNGIHTRCCNPHHIVVESHAVNMRRRRCGWVSEEGCECGAEPSCLLFSGPAYLAQCHAMEELFQHFPKLTVSLPGEAQFMHDHNGAAAQ